MNLIRRYFPLQLSILLHGSLVLILLVLKTDTEKFKENEVIDLSVYTTPIVATKPSFPTQSTSASRKVIGVSSKATTNEPETAEKSDSTDPIPTADYLITEEPKVISEPKNKQRTDEARKNGYTGTAKLKILIDINGNVRDVKLLNSLKYGLDERAIELARQVKLSPAKVEGKPVNVIRDFTITFKATD